MNIKEYVAYNKSHEIEKALVKKYGESAFGPGTFGVEFEFAPDGAPGTENFEEELLANVDPDYLVMAVGRRDFRFEHAYIDWLMDKRKDANRRMWRGWDDSYGPPSVDEWVEMNPEPEDEEEDKKSEWEINKKDAEWEYRNWERRDMNDYMSEFVSDLGSGIWNYITVDDVLRVIRNRSERLYQDLTNKVDNSSDDIADATYFIESKLGQKVGPAPTETTWNVGMDGDNVEIRTRHLKKEEIPLAQEVLNWLKGNAKQTSGDTSAHVHVGLPKNFSAFSMLAMATLVDEKAVKVAAGPQRDLKSWAALRDQFEVKITSKIEEILKEKGAPAMKIKDDKLREIVKKLSSKMTGTNISSVFERNTVEFRYLGSNIDSSATLGGWIKYFMLLPKIAESRNQIKLGNVIFTKEGEFVVVSLAGKKKPLTIPSDEPDQKYIEKLKAKKLGANL